MEKITKCLRTLATNKAVYHNIYTPVKKSIKDNIDTVFHPSLQLC